MSQSEAAINEIGEPAIPILLSKLQAKDPPWKDSLYKLCNRIPRSPIRFTWARDEQQEGVYGFACLGPKARPAIPQLTKLLYESNSANSAGLALACIGDESLSVLRTALVNATNQMVQEAAMYATSQSSNMAVETLPEMRILRTNAVEVLAAFATTRLIRYAPNDEAEAVAFAALQSGRPRVRISTLNTLTRAKIDKNKSAAVLVGLLNDRDYSFRVKLTNTLRQIHPEMAASVGISTNSRFRMSGPPRLRSKPAP